MMGNQSCVSLYSSWIRSLVLPGYFLQLRGTLRYYNSYWAPLCKHTHAHTKSAISPFDLK